MLCDGKKPLSLSDKMQLCFIWGGVPMNCSLQVKRIARVAAAFLLCVVMLGITVSAYASPDVLPASVESTAVGYVTLKAPEQLLTSTTSRKLPISATAPQGVLVSVYRYNYATGCYHKITNGDVPLESVVGSTMLFAGQVDLNSGMNKFLIRGAKDDSVYTVVKFDVNVLNEGFMDRIKGVISVIFN